jgi:hypothetical protein
MAPARGYPTSNFYTTSGDTTTDSNLKYQQNLKGRRIAIVVLTTTSLPRIEHAAFHS